MFQTRNQRSFTLVRLLMFSTIKLSPINLKLMGVPNFNLAPVLEAGELGCLKTKMHVCLIGMLDLGRDQAAKKRC